MRLGLSMPSVWAHESFSTCSKTDAWHQESRMKNVHCPFCLPRVQTCPCISPSPYTRIFLFVVVSITCIASCYYDKLYLFIHLNNILFP